MGPHPAVAAARLAVRTSLADLAPGSVVLVACSGGADSLALASALAFEARGAGWLAGGVTVDHGLQQGSDTRAEGVAATLRGMGLGPVEVAQVYVGTAGGPEGAARTARYEALDAIAEKVSAAAVLLGHTRDDQAETVLLGLARGSGARSLAGMAARSGTYRRPFLALERSATQRACSEAGLAVWEDPHNLNAAYARVRVRHGVLPVLEHELGPGVTAALARTADQLRDDADALDEWATRAAEACLGSSGVDVAALADLPAAIRRRVLRRAALSAGSPANDLSAGHLAAIDALVTSWHGQAFVELPGGIRVHRVDGRLELVTPE